MKYTHTHTHTALFLSLAKQIFWNVENHDCARTVGVNETVISFRHGHRSRRFHYISLIAFRGLPVWRRCNCLLISQYPVTGKFFHFLVICYINSCIIDYPVILILLVFPIVNYRRLYAKIERCDIASSVSRGFVYFIHWSQQVVRKITSRNDV